MTLRCGIALTAQGERIEVLEQQERALLEENVRLRVRTACAIDMEELDYISSAGLRVLLFARKAMDGKGSLRVTHVNETIMEIFEVTGFADILTIE